MADQSVKLIARERVTQDTRALECDANGNLYTRDHNDEVIDVPPTMLFSQGTAAVSGVNTIVNAPGAGFRIVVAGFVIQNESATATTMILRDGVAPAAGRFRCLGQAQGDGLSKDFDPEHVWKLAENNPVVLNLSGANSCGYTIQYYTEAV
jgi:hypothetical protein